MRNKLSGLKEKRDLAILTTRLSDVEAKKAAGFPIKISKVKTSSEAVIRRQILQESKLVLPFVKAYLGQTYAHYQNYVSAYEHVFNTRPTTYRKDADCVLYSIRALKGTPSITWYWYAEGHGRLSIS